MRADCKKDGTPIFRTAAQNLRMLHCKSLSRSPFSMVFTCNFIFRKDTYMTNSHPLTRLQKFRLLSLIPLYFMIVGLFLQPITEILPGLWTLIKEPDFLITDYFLVGGIGTSFINAGLLTLLCIWTIYFLDMEMDGHTITSSCLMFGFSLFGKNLLNIWAILFGVYLYSHYHKTHLSRYVYIGFYGTSLSPIITQIMYISQGKSATEC